MNPLPDCAKLRPFVHRRTPRFRPVQPTLLLPPDRPLWTHFPRIILRLLPPQTGPGGVSCQGRATACRAAGGRISRGHLREWYLGADRARRPAAFAAGERLSQCSQQPVPASGPGVGALAAPQRTNDDSNRSAPGRSPGDGVGVCQLRSPVPRHERGLRLHHRRKRRRLPREGPRRQRLPARSGSPRAAQHPLPSFGLSSQPRPILLFRRPPPRAAPLPRAPPVGHGLPAPKGAALRP